MGLLLLATSWGGCVRAGFERPGSDAGTNDLDAGGDAVGLDAVGDAVGLDATGPDGSCTWRPFSSVAAIPNVSSTTTDWDPHLASDGLTLYFSSKRPGGLGNFDIWVTKRATVNDAFGEPTNLAELNTATHDGAPTTSVDGLELFMSHDSDIHRSTRQTTTSSFSKPAVVTGLLPAGMADVGGPFLTADGLTLYYTVCKTQHCAIAVAKRSALGASFAYVRTLDELGPQADSQGWPTASANQLEIYFEVSQSPGTAQIWLATRSSVSKPFGAGTLVKELAGSTYSADPDLSPDGRTMVLAVISSGSWNLFMATRQCQP